MSKDGSKINKVCAKKKVNRMNKAECTAELERLSNDNSKYKADVKERLSILSSVVS